jgi:hypothetical protein
MGVAWPLYRYCRWSSALDTRVFSPVLYHLDSSTHPEISGFSFGYSAFINGHFLGSGQGSSHSQQGVDILSPVFNFTVEQLVTGDNGNVPLLD